MAEYVDNRINAMSNTADSPADDDYVVIDGSTNGSRKLLTSKLAKADDVLEEFALTYEESKAAYVDTSNNVVESSSYYLTTFKVSKDKEYKITIVNHKSNQLGSAYFSSSIPSVGDSVTLVKKGTYTEDDATETFGYTASEDGYISICVFSSYRVKYCGVTKIITEAEAISKGVFSSSDKFNNFFVELYTNLNIASLERIEINKTLERDSDFISMIRFWISVTDDKYITLFRIVGAKYDVSTALTAYNSYADDGIFIHAIVDWDAIDFNSKTIINCSTTDFTTDFKTLKANGILYSVIQATKKDETSFVDYDEILTPFTDETITDTNTYYPFSSPIQSENSISVFVNGVKKRLGTDYVVDYRKQFVKFTPALSDTDVVNVCYTTRWVSKDFDLQLDDCSFSDDDGKITDGKSYPYLLAQFNDFGKESAQWMESVASPTDATKNVVSFVAKTCTNKCRCQLAHYGMNANELDASVDVYIPSSSFDCLKNYENAITWFTIQEFWAPYGTSTGSTKFVTPGYRVSVGMWKNAGTDESLYFGVKAEDRYLDDEGTEYYAHGIKYDDLTEKKFPIPYDSWITINTKIKCGRKDGRFALSVTANNKTTSIIDVAIPVQSPLVFSDKYEQESYATIKSPSCIAKMYTGAQVLRYVASNSSLGELRMYFKNMKWTERNGIE